MIQINNKSVLPDDIVLGIVAQNIKMQSDHTRTIRHGIDFITIIRRGNTFEIQNYKGEGK